MLETLVALKHLLFTFNLSEPKFLDDLDVAVSKLMDIDVAITIFVQIGHDLIFKLLC